MSLYLKQILQAFPLSLLPLPRFYFIALLFTSHRSPLSESLEQANSLYKTSSSPLRDMTRLGEIYIHSTDIKGQHWVSSSLNFSGARVKAVFDWNILQKCLATSCSTFQSAVQEKNVDLHLRLQRLTTRIFDYQPKNGQKRKRVSKYKSSVKRATVNYFSIVFLEFCNLKWLIITECNQSRWQIRIPCAYIRLNFDQFSSGRKCCRTEMK